MLVLTRKKDEVIHIDGGIVFKVIDIDRGRVRLGIEAPEDMRILRKEIIDGEKSRGT